jgi:hypothetical protein
MTMKKSLWRRLAQRLAYPKWWPVCISFYEPMGNEPAPPQMQIRINNDVYLLK